MAVILMVMPPALIGISPLHARHTRAQGLGRQPCLERRRTAAAPSVPRAHVIDMPCPCPTDRVTRDSMEREEMGRERERDGQVERDSRGIKVPVYQQGQQSHGSLARQYVPT